MKRITLAKILNSLERMEHEIEIDAAIAAKARQAIERMIALPLTRQSLYARQFAPEVAAVEARA